MKRKITYFDYLIENKPNEVAAFCKKYNMFPRTVGDAKKALNTISGQGEIPQAELVEMHPDMDMFIAWHELKNPKAEKETLSVLDVFEPKPVTENEEKKSILESNIVSNITVKNVLVGAGITLGLVALIKFLK